MVISRRTALAGLAAGSAALAAGCTGGGGPGKPKPSPSVPIRAVDPHATQSFNNAKASLLLQVMAHPDDDLYFMNPDAEHIVRAGVPVVSVYVTAGEAVGQNWIEGMPKSKPDKAAYSSARHQGLRQAYAEMLGLDRFASWKKSVLDLGGGVRAETNELVNGDRRAQLVFLNIAMLSAGDMRLPLLWERPEGAMQSLVATGSPCTTSSTYHHDTLVDTLATLLDRFKPTVIHTMDPDPDYQVHDATHPKDNDYGACSDHRDHTPTALFTWKALSQWVADSTKRDGHPPRFVTTAFRGYYNQRWPHNLPPEVVEQKHRLVEAYGGDPSWDCGNPAGCGDYGQGGDRPLKNRKGWIRSTHYRYGGPTAAPGTDKAGRLEAYGVLGTQAVRWAETSAGSGRWGEPQNLGGGPLAPALASVRDSEGRRLLFALRFSALEGRGRPDTREIVVLEQRSPDGPFKAWQGLGNPEHRPDRGRRVGMPAAVAAPDGRVHLFVRNAGKGVSGRVREADGTWGKWQSLHGQEIQDGLTAVLDAERRVHVFGTGRDTVHHWTQDAPGQPVRYQPLKGLPQPGGLPGAALGGDGELVLVYRGPAAEQPTVYRLTPGSESPASTELHDFAGYGPLDALPLPVRGSGDTVLVLGRAVNGEIQLTDASGDSETVRADAKLVPVGTAAMAVDAEHRLCVTGMSPDASPWLWRPETPHG
ncbi:LmbE family protein [Streptomyces eurocidicus]|uniref:LmbE family N-acetylglucosaminyl deacetylase n=1 Tax=Streptomyces eurocidicus TaxID=66423 RepID=A0A2N8NS83_STREU|nr:PIG-L family deacetylase [Streptomyces eurocidicus]MBB5121526.1 LmbE family N-acetylglucosaminyl deacetylase [Streptomyces eurocidicus]MBF6054830.1 PIG-L family deacetylase [Streptomyces eurocidicus]PNE31621.1 LmbE family protein [Streptomyces eurocidicus]